MEKIKPMTNQTNKEKHLPLETHWKNARTPLWRRRDKINPPEGATRRMEDKRQHRAKVVRLSRPVR